MDGAAVVQMSKPSLGMTFSGYADNLLHKHIKPYLEHVERVDVVFDVYKTDSLKLGIRIKWGMVLGIMLWPMAQFPETGSSF